MYTGTTGVGKVRVFKASFDIFCLEIKKQMNEFIHVSEPLGSFNLSGHTQGFRPQTQTLLRTTLHRKINSIL